MMRKYARQIRLAEIGAAGQAKIAAATASVGRGFSSWVARRYLSAAGVASVVERDADEPRDARFDDLDPAARDVALGAHAATRILLEIVRS